MIRINLLGVERQKVKAAAFDISQHTGVLCAVMLVLASAGTGWWFWSLRQESAQVNADNVPELVNLLRRIRGTGSRR